ncbi:hypothetical protein L208DRAFT_1261097, partial [Tricholoma matsutake]
SFGPMLIGAFLNAILYGVSAERSPLAWASRCPETALITLQVLYLFIIETVNTACDVGVVFQPLILEFGENPSITSGKPPIFFPHTPIATVMISSPVQIFTAWRIMIISRSKWMGLVISALSLASFAGGLWTTVDVAVFRVFARKPELNRPGVVWFVASAVADVLITGSLIYSLNRRKTGLTYTDSYVNRIIRLTVQTGLVTSFFALTDLVSFLISPETAISFIWDFSLSKLYTNALLSTFNARAGWNHLTENGQNPDNVLFGKEDSRINTFPRVHFFGLLVFVTLIPITCSSLEVHKLGTEPLST